jgi:hypothetical protein
MQIRSGKLVQSERLHDKNQSEPVEIIYELDNTLYKPQV